MITLRRWWHGLSASVDHRGVLDAVDRDARLSAAYLWQVALAAGIAMIGLLANSATVIIGAMLVSPLMAPIVGLGMGVATLSLPRVLRALVSLLAGLALALAVTFTIVWLSPIRELTPEILARTRPTLFDLLVAVFSGLAGGFALVRGKGGTVVGVAIATALMPPATVVGFGLATGDMAVARGALLLLAANTAAIALAVTAVAAWYGFARGEYRQALAWQVALGVLLMVPIAQPLVTSLRAMADEATRIRQVRGVLAEVLGDGADAVLDAQVAVHADRQGQPVLDVVYAGPQLPEAQARRLEQRLADTLGAGVRWRISRIPVDDGQAWRRASSLSNPVQALRLAEATAAAAAAATTPPPALDLPQPLLAREVDPIARRARLVMAPGAAGLAVHRESEQQLRSKLPGWDIAVVPPAQALPALPFAAGSAALDDAARQQLDLVRWAVARWGGPALQVEGSASLRERHGADLAQARAQAVAAALAADGAPVTVRPSAPTGAQAATERQWGEAALRVARVQVLP